MAGFIWHYSNSQGKVVSRPRRSSRATTVARQLDVLWIVARTPLAAAARPRGRVVRLVSGEARHMSSMAQQPPSAKDVIDAVIASGSLR
jgi:hypothetical protein